MRIALTGGNGLIGRAVVEMAAARQDEENPVLAKHLCGNLDGRNGSFDCSRAERLLGRRHDAALVPSH
jgi:hypothetical protein